MFGRIAKSEPSILDDAIARVLVDMEAYGPDSPEYPKLLAYLERLNKLKMEKHQKRVSPDTMALVIGNLLCVIVIVSYERVHVMSSKGLNFLKHKT